jgi:hypothetical protein
MSQLFEDSYPLSVQGGFRTNLPVTLGGAVSFTGSTATSFSVGPNGATNPAFNVDASTASSATGLNIKSAAAAAGVAVSAISSGTNENLTIDAKGSGTITLNGTATGAVISGAAFKVANQFGLSILDNSTVTGAAGAATLNRNMGVVTTESLTTAASTTFLYTITNTRVAATDVVQVQISSTGTGTPVVSNVIPGSGSFTVLIANVHTATAFNAACKLYFVVFKAT